MAPSTSFNSRISSWAAVLLVAVNVEYGGGGGLDYFCLILPRMMYSLEYDLVLLAPDN